MMKRKPIVGETLYSLNIGNAARYSDQKLTPVVVSKVGRKYFYADRINSSFSTKYHLDSWVEATNYCANSKLYETEEEWADDKLKEKLLRLASDAFSVWSQKRDYTTEQLSAVCKILNIEFEGEDL